MDDVRSQCERQEMSDTGNNNPGQGQGQGQPDPAKAEPDKGKPEPDKPDNKGKPQDDYAELKAALDAERKQRRETEAKLNKLEKDRMTETEKAIAQAKDE